LVADDDNTRTACTTRGARLPITATAAASIGCASTYAHAYPAAITATTGTAGTAAALVKSSATTTASPRYRSAANS
jgi:hypothetical protein